MTRIVIAKKRVSSAAAKPKAARAKAKPAVARTRIVAKTKAPAMARPAAKPVVAEPKAAIGSRNGAVPRQLADSTKMPEHKEKVKKPKLVRDSFTMPEAEYQVLGDVKKACLRSGVAVKKSELLRVGVALIRKLDLAKLKEVLAALPPLKPGRPKREK